MWNSVKRFFLVGWFTGLLLGNASASTPEGPSLPEWLEGAVFYQIYPASYLDTDGNGIGDLGGIIQKLDYIQSLGCNTIWLNPCFCSSFFDGGYDVTDYLKVDPRYGTNRQLESLFHEAHRRGMHVVLDLVAGHTSIYHPWFLQSQKKKKNRYSNRYIWTNDSLVTPVKFVRGKFERNGAYLKNYYEVQPALNYGYQNIEANSPWQESPDAKGPRKTREALMKIMDYWMKRGCDGFRIDMAGSLVKNDPDLIGTRRLWHEIRTHYSKKWPDGVLLAEWGHPEKAVDIGFMMDFLFQFGLSGYRQLFFNNVGVYRRDTCYFDKKGAGEADTYIHSLQKSLKAMNGKAYLCLPTGNHDSQRLMCGDRNDENQLKLVFTMLLTQPAVPCIYYGDEIGMKYRENLPDKEGSLLAGRGNRAGSRTPMQWDNTKGHGFSTAPVSAFYLPVDDSPSSVSVENAEKDSLSLLHFVRKILSIRKQYSSLGVHGNIDFLKDQNNSSYPMTYVRSDDRTKVLVCINPTDRAIDASYTSLRMNGARLLMNVGKLPEVNQNENFVHLVMEPLSSCIYLLDR